MLWIYSAVCCRHWAHVNMGNWLKILILVAVTIFSQLNYAKHFHSIAGPFRVIIRHIEECPPEKQPFRISYNIREVVGRHANMRESITFDGNVATHMRWDDSLAVRVLVSSWSNMGGWKENAHVANTKQLCKSWAFWFPEVWRSGRIAIFGEPVPCPWFPGIYNFHNVTFSWKDIPIKDFFYGRWRADFKIVCANGDTAGCKRLFLDTVPR